MIIQKQKNMTVEIENSKGVVSGKKILILSQNDGFHCQVAILTKKQAEKLARELTS